MIKLHDKSVQFPDILPHIRREKLATAKQKAVTYIGDYLVREGVDIYPQAGLQEQACITETDVLWAGSAATGGKATPYHTKVLTPRGWTTKGELKVGDEICGSDGKGQLVEAIYEQGIRTCVRMTLSNGASCECDLEHLWLYKINGNRAIGNTNRVLSNFSVGHNISIPVYSEQNGISWVSLKSITSSGVFHCRCIRVSNFDRLYIIDDFIVTHNTFSGFMKAASSIGVPKYTARLVTLRQKDVENESSYIRDMRDIFTKIEGCSFSVKDGATASWKSYNNTIMAIHANFNVDNPSEWEQFTEYIKANQASYFYWDELTSIKREKTYLYSFSRNRDASGLRLQSYATFNLKQNHWTYHWLKNAGYVIHIDGEPYPRLNPDMVGVVKYFYVQEQSVEGMVWGDTRAEVVAKCNIKVSKEDIEAEMKPEDMVKSFTIITGEAAGNRLMVNATQGGSIANLHATGGKYRDSLKGGYFVDDAEDDKLTVSQKMIEDMWVVPQDYDQTMYATLDVSDGAGATGRCVMWIFRGRTAIALKLFDGDPKELELWIKSVLNEYGVQLSNFCFDGGGLGNYLRAYTGGISIKGQLRTVQEYDEAGNPVVLETYFNLRSQLLGRVKTMLEKGELSIAVPAQDRFPHGKWSTELPLLEIMKEESNLFITTTKNNKIYYKSKDEFKDKFKYSPDYMDSFWQIGIFHLNTKDRKEIEVIPTRQDFMRGWSTNKDAVKQFFTKTHK